MESWDGDIAQPKVVIVTSANTNVTLHTIVKRDHVQVLLPALQRLPSHNLALTEKWLQDHIVRLWFWNLKKTNPFALNNRVRNIVGILGLAEFAVKRLPAIGDYLVVRGDPNDLLACKPRLQALEMNDMHTAWAFARWQEWVVLLIILAEAETALGWAWLRYL